MSDPIVHFALPKNSGKTIRLRNEFGGVVEIDNVNMLVSRDGAYYITRRGESAGHYPQANYSVEWDT